MQEEIPAFLDYLDKRKIHTENKSRAWFQPKLIRTEALKKVIEASKPKIVRELEHRLKEMFTQFGNEEIYLSIKDIGEQFFEKNYKTDNDYISRTLKKHFPKVKQYINKEGKITTKRYKIPFWRQTIDENGTETFVVAYKPAIGYPFVFKANEFFSPEEYQKFESTVSGNMVEDLPF